MTETPEPTTRPTSVAAAPPPAVERAKLPRLYAAAAWVVIVAGIVFILSTVFFTGAIILGHHNHCHSRYHHGMMFRPGGPGPGNAPWQYGGPGMFPPPPYPGGPPPASVPGQTPAPSQTPSTPAPRP